MLKEEEIFKLSNKKLNELIKGLNQIHISLQAQENPSTFSYLDFCAKKEDVLSGEALISVINKVQINDNGLTCEKFYKTIRPTLNSILERKVFNKIKGYEIELLRIQISLPLDVLLLVNDEVPQNDSLVPTYENADKISYDYLEFEILETLKDIKYILNNGQDSRYCCLEYDSECIKAIRVKHSFYRLNHELKQNANKKEQRLKL